MNPFEKALKASRKLKESNDCSVITTSVLTGEPYERIHGLYEKQGRVSNSPVMGSTIEKVLKDHFNKTLVSHETSKSFKIKSINKHVGKGSYIGITKDHAFAVVDGEIFDDSENSEKIVKYVVKVV